MSGLDELAERLSELTLVRAVQEIADDDVLLGATRLALVAEAEAARMKLVRAMGGGV